MEQTLINLKKIQESKSNSRKITKESLSDIMKSIEAIGMIQAIIVRQLGKKDSYEIIAGHRRFHAHKFLKIELISAVVVEAKDDLAQSIQVAENMIRENLSPIEEAEAIDKLIKKGFTVEQAADQLGRDSKFIIRRRQLTKLSKTWIKRLKDPKHPVNQYWGSGHLEFIARYDHEKQEILAKEYEDSWDFEMTNNSEYLKKKLNRSEFKLVSARWKLADEILLPKAGSCLNCNKRSGCEPLLFHDDDTEKSLKKNEKCLDKKCWTDKSIAFIEKKIIELKDKYGDVAFVAYGNDLVSDKFDNNNTNWYYNYEVKKKSDKNVIPAIVVSMEKSGNVIWVSKNKSSSSGFPSSKKAKKSIDQKVESLKTRRHTLIAKNISEIIKSDKTTFADLDEKKVKEYIAIGLIFGVESYSKYGAAKIPSLKGHDKIDRFPQVDVLSKQSLPDLFKAINNSSKQSIINYLYYSYVTSNDDKNRELVAQRVTSLYDINLKNLQDQAKEEIKIPKSWGFKEKEIKKYNL